MLQVYYDYLNFVDDKLPAKTAKSMTLKQFVRIRYGYMIELTKNGFHSNNGVMIYCGVLCIHNASIWMCHTLTDSVKHSNCAVNVY